MTKIQYTHAKRKAGKQQQQQLIKPSLVSICFSNSQISGDRVRQYRNTNPPPHSPQFTPNWNWPVYQF